jgi:hypothetical protein
LTVIGGYGGATVLAVMRGPRSPSLRKALLRLVLLVTHAAVSGVLGALLIGPALGVVSGYNAASTHGVRDEAAVGAAAPAAGTFCHGPGTRGRAAGTTVRSAE